MRRPSLWSLLCLAALLALCAGGLLRLTRVSDYSPLSWRTP
jgi:hypothetical protein